MVMQIAFGILFGYILLAAFVIVIYIISVFISKAGTFRRIDKYDDIWEEKDNNDE